MAFTIDIDIGGTFTDGFITCGDRVEKVKVETTPHDLTVCFKNCITEGARKYGLKNISELLSDSQVIRYSTTVGTNTIIQKSGTKVGIIVTKGYEKCLYHETEQVSDSGQIIGSIIAEDMIVGVDEEVDGLGKIVKEIKAEEVKRAVKYLLDSGARCIVVSLKHAFANPIHEKKIKEIINKEYPKHYLGAIPVLLASQVSIRPGDYYRTNSVLINAYLHKEMVRHLYKTDENLRQSGYTKPLLIVHSTGGVARVAKTKAISTYNSGPAAGLLGSLSLSRLYGIENILSIDVGGTSTDVGIITKGGYHYNAYPALEGIPINLPMIEVGAIGGGGGSIARFDNITKNIIVGPESAGAMPGPASYDLGGMEPTVTDADLLLGYIDPDYFLGGMRKLNKERAEEAIKEMIARPLNVTVEEAAFRIKDMVDRNIAAEVEKKMKEKSNHMQDFIIFVYGGAGPTHCCGFAQHLNIPKIITFPHGAVFSAFGASTMDVMHTYELHRPLVLQDSSQQYFSDYKYFNEAVENLRKSATRDMAGEGFAAGEITFSLELEMWLPQDNKIISIPSPRLQIRAEEDVEAIIESIRKGFDREGIRPPDQKEIKVFRLMAHCLIPHYKFPPYKPEGKNPQRALKGKRKVYWKGSFEDTPVFNRELLRCANVVIGPAIIEAEDTTYVIPGGRRFTVDEYLNGIIEYV
jgi:N-methylhydantoinase A/acetophenone carboxylase